MGKLNYELESLDAVEDSYKDLYKSVIQDGKTVYRLDVDDAVSVTEKEKIYNALKSERELKSNAEKSLKAFGEWTPEKIQELSEKLVGLENNNGKPSKEFLDKMEEIKNNYQKTNQELKSDYETKLSELNKELSLKTNMLNTIKRDEALRSVYNESGDPTMFDAFRDFVSTQIEFDSNSNEWKSKDGLQNLKEVTESIFSKMPGFLKATISAGAKETRSSSGSWDTYFDPKSPSYNKDKQAELFRTDRDRAVALLRKYPIQ